MKKSTIRRFRSFLKELQKLIITRMGIVMKDIKMFNKITIITARNLSRAIRNLIRKTRLRIISFRFWKVSYANILKPSMT